MGNGATIDTGKLFNVGGAQHSAQPEEETAYERFAYSNRKYFIYQIKSTIDCIRDNLIKH